MENTKQWNEYNHNWYTYEYDIRNGKSMVLIWYLSSAFYPKYIVETSLIFDDSYTKRPKIDIRFSSVSLCLRSYKYQPRLPITFINAEANKH